MSPSERLGARFAVAFQPAGGKIPRRPLGRTALRAGRG
jgi:hypothetical protein